MRPADSLAGLPDGLDGRDDAGLVKGRGLRIELLDTINAQALAAYEEARARRLCADSAARRPALAVDGS